jgi:hypothetical protein
MMYNKLTFRNTIMIRRTKYLLIISLAVIGALYGAAPALAAPILRPDLASFAVSGNDVANGQVEPESETLALLAVGFGLIVLGSQLRRRG